MEVQRSACTTGLKYVIMVLVHQEEVNFMDTKDQKTAQESVEQRMKIISPLLDDTLAIVNVNICVLYSMLCNNYKYVYCKYIYYEYVCCIYICYKSYYRCLPVAHIPFLGNCKKYNPFTTKKIPTRNRNKSCILPTKCIRKYSALWVMRVCDDNG